MLKKMIVHTLLTALAIGALAAVYQAKADGWTDVAGLRAADRSHDD